MSFDLNAIWAEIKAGEDGDVIGAIFSEIEKFFAKLIGFLRGELEIAE